MDRNINAHIPVKKNTPAESSAGFDSSRLGAFFDLLLQIDKRNHSELYEHNKSGATSDQTSKRADGLCMRGD